MSYFFSGVEEGNFVRYGQLKKVNFRWDEMAVSAIHAFTISITSILLYFTAWKATFVYILKLGKDHALTFATSLAVKIRLSSLALFGVDGWVGIL